MVTKGRRKGTIRFLLRPGKQARKVQVAGDFTGWKPKTMRRQKGGHYVAIVRVAPGDHQYKFVVDGQWITDPDSHLQTANTYGTLNSVLQVD